MRFEEMFPNVDVERYSRQEALRIVLRRFAYRYVYFTAMEAKSFYGLPEKEIVQAAQALAQEGVFIADGDGCCSPLTLRFCSEKPLRRFSAYSRCTAMIFSSSAMNTG